MNQKTKSLILAFSLATANMPVALGNNADLIQEQQNDQLSSMNSSQNIGAFDWRNHMKLEDVKGQFYDASGDLMPYYERNRVSIENRLAQTKILKNVLDQISHIPQIQEDLKQASYNAQIRIQQNHDMYGDEKPIDQRIMVKIGGATPAQYDIVDNSLKVSPEYLSGLKYEGVDGKEHAFSLQRAVIHEIGHAKDPTFTPKREFEDHLEAAEQAIEKTLKDFPEFKEEYNAEGTIAGRAISQILNSQNSVEFDNKVRRMFDEPVFTVEKNEKDIKKKLMERSARQNNGVEIMPEVVVNYFFNQYQRGFNHIVDIKDELPTVARTNKIMSEYFPSSVPRNGYATVSNIKDSYSVRSADDYPIKLTVEFKEKASITMNEKADFAPAISKFQIKKQETAITAQKKKIKLSP